MYRLRTYIYWVDLRSESGEGEGGFEVVDGVEMGAGGGFFGDEGATVFVGFDDFIIETNFFD